MYADLFVNLGGIYSPSDCQSRQQLAVIIPFRNREHPLKILLRHLHPFLQRQKRAYQIFVVEQVHISIIDIHILIKFLYSYLSLAMVPLIKV